MNRAVWFLAGILTIAVTTTVATRPNRPIRPETIAQPVLTRDEGPKVDWNRPFHDAPVVPPTQASNPSAIRTLGGLRFTPIIPRFSVPPVLVQVTSDEVVFVYHFPPSPLLPKDGRVTVLEMYGLSQPDLLSMAGSNAKRYPGEVQVITLANGIPAIIDTNARLGLGGAELSLGKNVGVGIHGPALTPEFARQLAETFG